MIFCIAALYKCVLKRAIYNYLMLTELDVLQNVDVFYKWAEEEKSRNTENY